MNFGFDGNLPGMPGNIDPKQIMRNMTDEQLLSIIKNNPQLARQYDKLVKEQMSGPRGSKPVTMEEYKKLNGKIDSYLDVEGGVNIEPVSGICIKTFEQSGQKFFINVVQHPIVDPPEEKMLVDYENQPGLRIPMSLGRIKQDHDKQGNICKVVDAVMNPQVIEAVKKDSGLLTFLAEILINYIYEKHKIKLTSNYKMMKQLTYKGTTLEYHRVKGKKAPKIEQVSEQTYQPSAQQKSKEEELFQKLTNPKNGKLSRPQFRVYVDRFKSQQYDLECKDVKQLCIEIELPLLIHSKGIHLQVNEQMVYLFVKGIYEVYLRMPISVGKYTARFIKNRRVLELVAQAKEKTEEIRTETKKQRVNVRIESDLLEDLV